MEKQRKNPKRIMINVLIVAGLILLVFVVGYVAYIISSVSATEIAEPDLTGRVYADESGRVQLTFDEGKLTLRTDTEKTVLVDYEYTDGIIVAKTTDSETELMTEYTFVFLTGDRIFYSEKREMMYLLWYE